MTSIPNTNRKRKWINVTSDRPCSICRKDSWCSYSADGQAAICRRKLIEGGKRCSDKNGEDFFLYHIDDERPDQPVGEPPVDDEVADEPTRADPDTLHLVYSTLLDQLDLSEQHVTQLQARGLTISSDANPFGYRTLDHYRRD